MIDLDKDNTKLDCYRVALERSVVRAMQDAPEFAAGAPGVVILTAPDGYEIDDYLEIMMALATRTGGKWEDREGALIYVRANDKSPRSRKNFREDLRNNDRILVLAEHGAYLPPVLNVAADKVIELPIINASDFVFACKNTLGIKVHPVQAREALTYPRNLLWAAVRPGRDISDILQRLESQDTLKAIAPRPADSPALSEMFGYGEAKTWGLQLAEDVKAWQRREIDWCDVDRGIVLSGPPGVGKTIFAKALAQECSVKLVATSLAQWQAAGHLGDLLKAMRKAFSDARNAAPSILFIDELDSVGDRAKFGKDDNNYSLQVVNGLLEALDGLGDRQGVIVVGATNNIAGIDHALLRAGRLDKHVAIAKPNPLDRIAIVEAMTDLTFEGQNRNDFLLSTLEMTGADIAKAVRDGRRLARKARRTLLPEDVIASLPKLLTPTPEFLRLVAIHETGHTLVGVALRCGDFGGTMIFDRLPISDAGFKGGLAQFALSVFTIQNRQAILDKIAVLLGGIAAEELWLGTFCDGAGGSSTSDLGTATRFATLMETSLGMGSTYRYSVAETDKELEALRQSDPDLRKRVEEILEHQFNRAKDLITTRRKLGDLVIEELLQEKRVSPERLQELQLTLKRKRKGPTVASAPFCAC
ncbi:AAA family ATPase [Rhizobium sp.]|uniref:AAA family ATPase n=1 Tax=Rhizobium sp. TaxID=391 RepID=UPI0028A6999C